MNKSTVTDSTSPSLYASLMGATWDDVDEEVRHFHQHGTESRRIGLLRVERGTGWVARLLLSVMRMPHPGEAITTELIVTPFESGERWVRKFGDRTLETHQAGSARGVLVERFSVFELRFRLEATNGSLMYRQIGTALRMGPLTIPFPKWLWPRVEAREEAGKSNHVHISVAMAAPIVGFLISYAGQMADV